jgi:hypothetical protein
VTFSEDTDCNGLTQEVTTSQTCTVSIDDFKGVPYQIDWGQGIYAKVQAINVVGSSEPSDEGNGAVILTIP